MKSEKRHNYKLAIIVVLVAVLGSTTLVANAVWNEKDAVHIKADEIENSTLIIGTHLIHLSSLTDSLYDIAQDSAADSGQSNIYYKSELADGTWYDISTANSLLDITTSGTPVTDDVIEALFLTYHTKSDGITYDLRTNTPVNIFNLDNPYDISAMDELTPLKNQWQLIVDSVGDTDVSNRIKKILEADVSDETTTARDTDLSALQRYLDVLTSNNGGATEQTIVQRVMEGVDADRRVYILTKVDSELETYMDELAHPTPKKSNNADEKSTTEQSDTALISAVSESIKNVDDSIINYDGKKLSAGTTVYQFFRYKFETALVTDANADNHSSCDVDVSTLISLDNILNDTISDRPAELALLKPSLLDEASNRYTNLLKQGQSAEYAAAVENQSASVLLNSISSSNTSTINTARNELEFMISAYCTRVSVADASAFLDERITLTKTYYPLPPSDAFLDGASSTIDAHIEFLTQKKRTLELASGGNELDKILVEKADLNTALRSALDKNNLEGAAEIEKKISDLNNKISDLENASANLITKLSDKVSDLEKSLANAENSGNTSLANKLKGELGAAKADLTNAQSSLSDGTLANQVAILKKGALSDINTDNPSSSQIDHLENNIGALCELLSQDSQLVFPALVDLHKAMAEKSALNSSTAFDNAMAVIEEAILNNKDSYDAAIRSDNNADDLARIYNDFLNEDADSSGNLLNSGIEGGGGSAGDSSGVVLPVLDRQEILDKYGAEVYVLALQSYYNETGSEDALNLIASTSQQQRNLGSYTIYSRIFSSNGEYIPLSAISSYSGMRYVEKDGGNSATLAQRGEYFGFKVYSDAVSKGKTAAEVDYMTQAADYLNGIHIIEDYSYKTFGIDCVYLSGCDYGVLCTDSMRELADELFALFLA